MKKGFALLETLVVVTLLSISLLALYGTFSSMIKTSKKNTEYDDVVKIYQTYYLKEYFNLYGLKEIEFLNAKELTCEDFSIASCQSILEEFSVQKMYLVKGEVKQDLSLSLEQYLNSLSNLDKKRLVVEYLRDDEVIYASVEVEDYE